MSKSTSDRIRERSDPASETSLMRRNNELEQQIARLSADLSAERKLRRQQADDLLHARERLDALLDARDNAEVRKLRKVARRKKKATASAIVCWTDWHSEAIVDPEMVDGANTFNEEVCDQRIQRLLHKTLYLLDFARHVADIRHLNVWLGGDLINGLIHMELRETNSRGQASAIRWVQERIATGLQFLLDNADIDGLTVVTSYGNHGRDGREKHVSNAYDHSWEWLAYHNLSWLFRDDPRVRFQVGKGYHNWLDVAGHDVRFHHGDAIRFAGGVGGVAIPLKKKIARWNTRRKPAFDVLGHFHHHIHESSYVLCGALVGHDAYSEHIGAEFQPPTQTFIVVDREYGKVMALPIFVEEAGRDAA